MLGEYLDKLVEKNKSLVLFILIIAANFVADIVSCDLRREFESNMVLKHITSLLLFYVFVVNTENSTASPFDNIQRCLLLYILFIVMMRTTLYTLTINMSLIFLNYFIHNYKEYYYKPDSKEYKMWSNVQRGVIFVNIMITIVSITWRVYMLKSELKDNFNIVKFMLGINDKECLNTKKSVASLLRDIHSAKKKE